jgi:hypothetical protein
MARYQALFGDARPGGYGLRNFVDFLVEIANEGEFDKKGKRRLTHGEHARLVGHGQLLSNAVEELARILSDQQPHHVRKRRLDMFWQALGSAAVIASYQAKNPLVERQELERAAHATSEKNILSQRVDDIIVNVSVATQLPRLWRNNPDRGPWWAAGEIDLALNNQLAEKRLPLLKRDAIRRRLEKLKPRILSEARAKTPVIA